MATYDDEFSGSVSIALLSINQDHVVLWQKQLEVLQSVYGGHDVFVWFPTGYGKSLCYQVLPYIFDDKLGLTKAAPSEHSVVLVISPLVNAAYFLRYIQPFIMDAYTKYFM